MNAVRITRISQMTMLFYDPHTRFFYKNHMVIMTDPVSLDTELS